MHRGVHAVLKVLCRQASPKFLPVKQSIKPRFFSMESPQQSPRTSYDIVESGSLYSSDYKLYFKGPHGAISPFHDIPLYANAEKNEFNMIVEVPRWTNAKMEISTSTILNPIKQDIKNGKPRFVNNVFPHHGYIWNYGALPQTWEDPTHTDASTGAKGDNDPLDVCEIGYKVHKRGAVIRVKVLGTLALIDEGETDWKLIVIDVTDPLAAELEDIEDVEVKMPGFIKATHEWFKIYKMPTGKPPNEFAFNGEAKNRAFAERVITETHEYWQKLMSNQSEHKGDLACENVSVVGSDYTIPHEEADAIVSGADASAEPSPIPDTVDKWFYVELKDEK
ncbi:uncharacterized protein LOC135494040 [Lineus longissimus]|uniref:uncharacterized protein LOC135494040 n=1 Tax=Lineus longissimus TaxID=88925 RepID=UPI002B4F608B